MKQIKIAICGGLRSGKDTVAELLIHNYGFKRYAFGDAIKTLCWEYYPERMALGKDRALLQGVGQDLRKYKTNVWVDKTLTNIYDDNVSHVVITDLRQPNEYEELSKNNFFIVRVNTDIEKRILRAEVAGDLFTPDMLNHETESYYNTFDVDYEINNNGTIDDLEQEVFKLYNLLSVKGGCV